MTSIRPVRLQGALLDALARPDARAEVVQSRWCDTVDGAKRNELDAAQRLTGPRRSCFDQRVRTARPAPQPVLPQHMAAFDIQHVLSVHHWNDTLFSFKTTRGSSLRFESGQFVMIGLEVDARPWTEPTCPRRSRTARTHRGPCSIELAVAARAGPDGELSAEHGAKGMHGHRVRHREAEPALSCASARAVRPARP